MAYTTPRTWTNGELVTDTMLNQHVRDNLRYLKGLDGVTAFSSGITVNGAMAATGAVSGTTGTFSGAVSGASGAFSGALAVTVNANASQGTNITNSNTGSSAYAHVNLINDSGTAAGFFRNGSANSAYAGANSLNILTIGSHPLSFGTANQPRLTIAPAGNVGIGTNNISPQGPLDVRGSYGKWLAWEGDAIGGTPVTILPAGTLAYGMGLQAITRSSTGTIYLYSSFASQNIGTAHTLGGSPPTIYNDGTNQCTVYPNADGSVTIKRNLGTSATFRVALQILAL